MPTPTPATSSARGAAGGAARRPWRASLRRSARLLGEFRHEQGDPDRFYTAVSDDAVAQLLGYVPLEDRVLLDVGGGRGYVRDAVEAVGGTYLVLDADRGELTARAPQRPVVGAVVGDALALPLRTDSVDVCWSVNVLEHVPDPWRMAGEMVRVTRGGGTVFLSYTVWWGPWGGHETAPWHYLGGHRARRRYERTHAHPPKNTFGESLFAVTVRAGLAWARAQERAGTVEVLDVVPRYNPRWTYWMARVPGLREVITWNLVIVLRKR